MHLNLFFTIKLILRNKFKLGIDLKLGLCFMIKFVVRLIVTL